MAVHVFAGPTLPESEVRRGRPGAVLHPPVRHGDLIRLGPTAGDSVLLIDGTFHQNAAVRHKEILAVLAGGVVVLGAASIGALRAAELHPYGMVGVGEIFRLYRDGVVDADDEVAVSHAAAGDHRALSVPLVSVRWALDRAVAAGALSRRDADELLAVAGRIHYTARSWRAVTTAAAAEPSGAAAAGTLRRFLAEHGSDVDLKRRDALLALDRLGDDMGAPTAVECPRTTFLLRWEARYRPADADRPGIPELAVLRWAQIYDADFPHRYAGYALGHVAAGQRPVRTAALAAAARIGVTPESVPAAALEHWLTPAETTEPPADRLLRVLVRSFRLSPGAAPFYDVPAELLGPPDRRAGLVRSVAAADEASRRVAATGPHREPLDIDPGHLRRHLAGTWAVPAGDGPTLLAAARDRGFTSVTEATDAARQFFAYHRYVSGPG